MLHIDYPRSRAALKGIGIAYVWRSCFLCGLLLLGVLQISGCSFVQSYPSRWPPPVISSLGTCPEISGVFQNKGESSSTKYVYLFDKLTNEGIWGTHECVQCTVSLQWEGAGHDKLQLTLEGWSQLLGSENEHVFETATLNADKGDFTCVDGALSIRFTEGFEAIAEGMLNSGTRSFFLDESNSLICEETATAIGHLLVVVPVGVKNVRYIRWQQGDR